jgi:hypothetical protein
MSGCQSLKLWVGGGTFLIVFAADSTWYAVFQLRNNRR